MIYTASHKFLIQQQIRCFLTFWRFLSLSWKRDLGFENIFPIPFSPDLLYYSSGTRYCAYIFVNFIHFVFTIKPIKPKKIVGLPAGECISYGKSRRNDGNHSQNKRNKEKWAGSCF